MSHDEHTLIQLGGDGSWVRQSSVNSKLYICPVYYENGKKVLPLQLTGARSKDSDQYERYRCDGCNSEFATHPRSNYYNPMH